MTAINGALHYSLSILIFMITIYYYHIVNKQNLSHLIMHLKLASLLIQIIRDPQRELHDFIFFAIVLVCRYCNLLSQAPYCVK